MKNNNSTFLQLSQIFIIKPTKQIITFFVDSYNSILSLFKFLFFPHRLFITKYSFPNPFHLSKRIFSFVIFCLVFKIAINELDKTSTTIQITELLKQLFLLISYLAGIYIFVLVGRLIRIINKKTMNVLQIDKLFIYSFNLFFIFLLSIIFFENIKFAFGLSLLITLHISYIFFHLRKHFEIQRYRNVLSVFIAIFIFVTYFFIMSAIFYAIWNME